MDTLWTKNGIYRRASYQNEADLEAAILQVRPELFGPNRIYLDIKKKIGEKGSKQNIPDAYLLDLNGQKPRLYVVENELAEHEPLRHIAVQILEFSLAFESARRGVRSILFNALEADAAAKAQCEQYLEPHEFRNLDHFLDYLVHDGPFAALVIIDELPDRLESVLINRFRFGVEVLEVARYEDAHGERFYRFEPFLADVSAEIAAVQKSGSNSTPVLSQDALDTIVVPAREDGFQEVFLGENKWYSTRDNHWNENAR